MNYEPTCAVCGQKVYPDTDHTVVNIEHKRIDDRNEPEEYYLHERCALNVFGGWESP